MTRPPYVAIRSTPFTVAEIEAQVTDPGNGAICTFSGVVRDHSNGRSVTALEYEAYVPMAEKVMRSIAEEIGREFPVNRLAIVHRVGRVSIGELAVVVSAGAAHRDAAFAAARAGIDRLKMTVPIWKKEHYTDMSMWVEDASNG